MKPAAQGYRLAVVGASSLLGKELLAVLEERQFPVSRLVTFEADEEEPDLPIVDLREHSKAAVTDEDVTEAELDFAFLAARPRQLPSFLRPPPDGTALCSQGITHPDKIGGRPGIPRVAPTSTGEFDLRETRCVVIDMGEGLAEVPGWTLSVPFLDREAYGNGAHRGGPNARLFVSAHPATIVISSLLMRLATSFPLKSAVAQVFGPASEIGPRAIEELQKQTVNLLSFQKIPQTIFGGQLAFNLLPRLGRARRGGARVYRDELTDLEHRIRHQLREYLGNRIPLPALRLFQVPVFYSMGFSLYVETDQPAAPDALGKALEGERIRLRRFSEPAPSQIEAAGTSEILVDAITSDAEHPAGIWIWATADNLRLAAVNAVEIAERLRALKLSTKTPRDEENN